MKIDKKFISKRFCELYHEKWTGTQAQFADAVKALDPENGISNNYVSKLLKGEYAPAQRNLQLFCRVLGVDYQEEFFPQAYEDKYKYSAEYQDKVSKYFEQLADSFGLNLSFLTGLRQLIDFDKDFPLFTELIVAAADPDKFIPSGLKYKRAEKLEAYKASAGQRLFQVSTGEKVVNMNPEDFKFLAEVQKTVVASVKEQFALHRQKLTDAETKASEKCEGCTFAYMIKSGHDPLSLEELQKIDESGIYTLKEYNKTKFPLPPDDLPLTSAHIDPGIVIGRKKK